MNTLLFLKRLPSTNDKPFQTIHPWATSTVLVHDRTSHNAASSDYRSCGVTPLQHVNSINDCHMNGVDEDPRAPSGQRRYEQRNQFHVRRKRWQKIIFQAMEFWVGRSNNITALPIVWKWVTFSLKHFIYPINVEYQFSEFCCIKLPENKYRGGT